MWRWRERDRGPNSEPTLFLMPCSYSVFLINGWMEVREHQGNSWACIDRLRTSAPIEQIVPRAFPFNNSTAPQNNSDSEPDLGRSVPEPPTKKHQPLDQQCRWRQNSPLQANPASLDSDGRFLVREKKEYQYPPGSIPRSIPDSSSWYHVPRRW